MAIREITDANQFIDIISSIKSNRYITFAYVNTYDIHGRLSRGENKVDTAKLQQILDTHKEKYGSTKAYQGYQEFHDNEKMKKYPYSIIQVIRYNMRWVSKNDFGKAYNKWKGMMNNIRTEYLLDPIGDKEGYVDTLNYGSGGVGVGNTDNTRDEIYLQTINTPKFLDDRFFICDMAGEIVEETTEEIFKMLKKQKADTDANNIRKKHNITDLSTEEEKAQVEQKIKEFRAKVEELNSTLSPRTFKSSKTLFITATTDDKKRYFYINTNLTDNIGSAKSPIRINPQSFIEFANEYAKNSFIQQESMLREYKRMINEFRNMRTNKKVVRLTESKLKSLIAEAVQQVLSESNPFTTAYPAATKSFERSGGKSTRAEEHFNSDRGAKFERYGDEQIAEMVGCDPRMITWSRRRGWEKPDGMSFEMFAKLGRILNRLKTQDKKFRANQERNKITDVGDDFGAPV